MLKTLEDLGYHTSHTIAYCPDYGVPQSRKRLVLLASLMGNIELIDPEYTPENYVTVRKAIANLPEIKSGETSQDDSLHFCAKLSELNLERIRSSKQGGTWRDWDEKLQLICHKRKGGKGYGSIYGRMEEKHLMKLVKTLA